MTKTSSAGPVVNGSTYTYTVRITNTGNVTGTYDLSDPIPANADYGGYVSGATYNPVLDKIQITGGQLGPNGQQTVQFTVVATDSKRMTNTASLVSGSTMITVSHVIYGSPAYIILLVSPTSVSVGGTATALAIVVDGGGLPVANGTVVNFNVAPLGSMSPVTTGTTSGVAVSSLSAGQVAGTTVVTATTDSLTSNAVTVTIRAGAPYTLTLVANPTSLKVNETSYLTATVVDQFGNNVADGTPVVFTTTLGSASPVLTTTTGGVATAALTSTVTGTATVRATSGTAYDEETVTFNPLIGGIVGQVALQGISGSLAGYTVTVKLSGTDLGVYTLDDSGTFTITGILAGTYNVWVKHLNHLAGRVDGVVVVDSVNTPVNFGTLLGGDAVDDNVVDELDLSALSVSFNKLTGDPAYNYLADFVFDGWINELDFSLIANNYGLLGDTP
jgi:hypothetical protein